MCDGYEADDALGMNQTEGAVICSIDKDLLQIPGQHYNFVKGLWTEITELDGWFNFYVQLLVGDTSDNIPGCPGIGKVKAPRILAGCKTPFEMYQACVAEYDRKKTPNIELNAQLLYIWRKQDDKWQPPKQEQEPKAA